jgi:hypothetical protein
MGWHTRRGRVPWVSLGAGVVLAVLVAVVSMQIHAFGEQLRKSEDDRQVLAEQVERMGGVPLVSPSPGPRGEQGLQGPAGRPPTWEEISRAVAEYLRKNPPKRGAGPSEQQIAAAVSAHLARNPPPSGRPPTEAEVAAAVAAYLAEHPPPRGERGEPGAQGEQGKTGPAGERGPQGEQGPAPTSWTWSWLGTTWECRQDPPGETTYRCEQETP